MNRIFNPYEILGLSRGTSEADVKKAYRDLVRKTHPDKGGTEEEFKQINEAYIQIMNGADPMDTFPELDELFKIFTNIGGFGALSGVIGVTKGPTIKTKLELTLEQLELGGMFSVEYQRNIPTGRYINSVLNTPFGVINGVGPEEIEKTFETVVDIPRCHDHRKSLIFSRFAKADSLPSGDLEITIVLIKHPTFTKICGTLDLQTELDITLKEALIGFDREIKLLNSEETVKIECRSVVNPYDIKRIQDYGMKLNEDKYGDLLIKFRIVFPVLISPETTEVIKNLEM